MNGLPPAVAVLSAMVTPAVLILACGSLSLTTSQRLNRAVERARRITERISDISSGKVTGPMVAEERDLLVKQLVRSARRARLLHQAMTSLYSALAVFVITSVVIGILAAVDREHAWAAIPFGLLGVALLLHTSAVLIIEGRLGSASIKAEMDFVLRLSRHCCTIPQQSPQGRSDRIPVGSPAASTEPPPT